MFSRLIDMQWRNILLTNRTTSTQNVASWVLEDATIQPSLSNGCVIPVDDCARRSTRGEEWHFNIRDTVRPGRKVGAEKTE